MFDLFLDPLDGDDLLSAAFATAGFLLLLAAAAAATAAAAAAAASFLFFFDSFLLVFPFVAAGLSFGLLFVVVGIVVVDVFGFDWDPGDNDLLLLADAVDDFDSFDGFSCSFEDDSTVVVVFASVVFTVSFSFTLACSFY